MPIINTMPGPFSKKLRKRWFRFWMRRASLSKIGRLTMRIASFAAPPDSESVQLAYINKTNHCGYISPSATVYHSDLSLGKHNFIGDQVIIIQSKESGHVSLGDKISIFRNCILATGQDGRITINDNTSLHHNTILKAFVSSIEIGKGVMIAANCALYSYNHEMAPGSPIRDQPLCSRGGIKIGDEAWIGTGVIILDGADIGAGAVIGAGSVVTGTIPDNTIAIGNPAKVVKYR